MRAPALRGAAPRREDRSLTEVLACRRRWRNAWLRYNVFMGALSTARRRQPPGLVAYLARRAGFYVLDSWEVVLCRASHFPGYVRQLLCAELVTL